MDSQGDSLILVINEFALPKKSAKKRHKLIVQSQ